MLTPNYSSALKCAVEAAQAAGRLLLDEFHRPGGPRGYGSHADADTEAEEVILAKLAPAFPDWGYLGEELGLRRPAGACGHAWVVDPNDATTSFLQGCRGPAVSIALLRERIPVLGVVFAYAAPDDRGDLLVYAEGCGPLRRNGIAVSRAWPATTSGSCTVLLARKSSNAERERLARLVAPMSIRESPSIAYRLALVAAGEADLTVSTTTLRSWDYAAGEAMLRGVGGSVLGPKGEAMQYDSNGKGLNNRRLFGGSHLLISQVTGLDWEAKR